MHSRRMFLGGAAMLAAGWAEASKADESCRVFTPAMQDAVDPAAAIRLLMEGNARFVSGETINCDLMAQVKASATGQAPFAAVVGCIDSRVPPELVFDQRLGSIFSARIAGNFVNTDIIGSLEFACAVAGAKAILVLGHSECGAIKGAIDGVELGNLTAMLANIAPAVAMTHLDGEHSSKNKAFVQSVAENNARFAAKQIVERSSVLKGLVDTGKLAIAPAMHDVATGRVAILG
jgi:carbonic anhydrase